MAYLFDTDAISELLRPRPLEVYVRWLATVPRDQQYTSAVTVGELYKGAYRSPACERHLAAIEERILPAVTTLPYDVDAAGLFGRVSADLETRGIRLPDADVQIAAVALSHELEVVTGNLRHFARIDGLRLSRVLADARRGA